MDSLLNLARLIRMRILSHFLNSALINLLLLYECLVIFRRTNFTFQYLSKRQGIVPKGLYQNNALG